MKGRRYRGRGRNEMQTQKLQTMPGRTINSFARKNNVKPIERCCPFLRKRKKKV